MIGWMHGRYTCDCFSISRQAGQINPGWAWYKRKDGIKQKIFYSNELLPSVKSGDKKTRVNFPEAGINALKWRCIVMYSLFETSNN